MINVIKFGPLILGIIIKIVVTRMSRSWLKRAEFDFGWGCLLDHAE